MNRRDFAKSLAALGLAPALPSLPAAAASSAPVAGFTPYMYGLGAHLARSTGQCSPALLMQKLRLAPEAAQAMQAQLLRNGILSASNAAGVATAAQPYMRVASPLGASSGNITRGLRQRARDWIENDNENSALPDAQTAEETQYSGDDKIAD